jgi:hypothetical protein
LGDVVLRADGTFGTSDRVSGRFSVDGARVIFYIDGLPSTDDNALIAERVGADELRFPPQHGRPEQRLVRATDVPRLQAAQPAASIGAPQASAPAPAASSPSAPPVDRSKPLNEYTTVDPSDAATARYLLAAFGPTVLTDDQKVSFLSVEGSRTTDVFARKELAAKELSGIEARLASTREHRYLRIDAVDPLYQQRAPRASRAMAIWQAPVPNLGHYELERKGFPVACMEEGSVSFNEVALSFHPTRLTSGKRCFLPVPDESVARALETQVSRLGGIVPMSVSLYMAVDGPAPHIGPQTLEATLVHLVLHVYPADLHQDGTAPAASFDIDVPQPPL